jgi:hypothetical protein
MYFFRVRILSFENWILKNVTVALGRMRGGTDRVRRDEVAADHFSTVVY